MAPENATVFVVEDDLRWQDRIKTQLASAGHTVAVKATTLVEAQKLIPTLEDQGVQVAIVDGNLGEDSHYGDDGITVIRQIQQQAPNVRTVGATLDPDGVPNADVNVWKITAIKDPNLLPNTVTEL